MPPYITRPNFASLEKKSPNKQHEFIAQYQDLFESKPVSKQQVKKGDHLQWTGTFKSYNHHAVCTKVDGEDVTVIEYTGPASGSIAVSQSTLSSDSGRLGGVIETTFHFSKLIEKNAELVVWPEFLRRFSPEEIVERAKRRLGENYYNITRNNCENFVMWCICGLKVSLQVKSWHVVVKEFLCSVINTVPMIAANFADEIISFLREKDNLVTIKEFLCSVSNKAAIFTANLADEIISFLRENNLVLWFDAAIEAGIAVYELYKVYQQYKKGNYQSKWDIVIKVILILAKGFLRFGLVYFGWNYGGKVLKYLNLQIGNALSGCISSFLDFISKNSDKAGILIEGGIAIYKLKKAWDQWQDGVLISTSWEFTVKVIEILSKGFLRFVLGYLGSKNSGKICEEIGGYLATLSKLTQSLFCGAAGGCLGHLTGAVIAWIVENMGYIVNSG